jgi:hypothetical protein
MIRTSSVALALVVAAVAWVGCGGGNSPAVCSTGAEGCHCFANQTCFSGLTCASNLCVALGGAGGTAGVSGMTGTGGTTGAAGTAGGTGTGGTAGAMGAAGTAGGAGAGGAAGTAGGAGAGAGGAAGTAGKAGTGGAAGTAGGAGAGGAGGTTAGAGGAAGAGGGGTAGTGTGGTIGCGGLIDDFEANTGYICQDNGRVGHWFSYKDSASTFFPVGTPSLPSPLPTPRGTSQRALHTYGTEVQYAGIGCSINDVPTSTYNASAYTGIRFFIMGTAVAPVAIVQTSETESSTYGGTCGLATLSCAGNYVSITGLQASSWTLVTVPFSSLSGGTAPFNIGAVWSIEFQPGIGAFDLWIDDLSFY